MQLGSPWGRTEGTGQVCPPPPDAGCSAARRWPQALLMELEMTEWAGEEGFLSLDEEEWPPGPQDKARSLQLPRGMGL